MNFCCASLANDGGVGWGGEGRGFVRVRLVSVCNYLSRCEEILQQRSDIYCGTYHFLSV